MAYRDQLTSYHSTPSATDETAFDPIPAAVLLAGLYETAPESTSSVRYRQWLDACETSAADARRADDAWRQAVRDLQYYRRTQPGCVATQERFVELLRQAAWRARLCASEIARQEPEA